MINIFSNEYRNNPYPYFEKMRSESSLFQFKKNCWGVTRYNDVKKILKSHELFSSADIVKEPNKLEPDFLFYTRGMVGKDKPDHTKLRQLLYKIFPHHKMLEPIIRQACHQLLNNIKNQPTIDIVKTFFAPLPIIIIANLLGIDENKTEEFRHWILILLTWRLHYYPDKETSIHTMFHYFTNLINERKHTPKSDLISLLVLASEKDKAITTEEVLALIRLLFVASTDTTTNLLGNAFRVLVNNPEYISFLQNQPHKIGAFIEEALRYDGPVICLYRRVVKDVDIDNMALKKNDLIFPFIASANHDETIFVNPECFDIERENKAHISFGSGIHHCFSSHLAKLQARITFEELLSACHSFESADKSPLIFVESFFFRGLKGLPVKILWNR